MKESKPRLNETRHIEPDSQENLEESSETIPGTDTKTSNSLRFSDEASTLYTPFNTETVTPFIIHDMIGRGGFGEVFDATQTSLSRRVAVKRVRPDLYEEAKTKPGIRSVLESNFRKEALILAGLEHPNIVPIHDLSLDEEGHPTLAMKLVRGIPWDRAIHDDYRRSVPEFLARHLPTLIAVGQAVAFAHSRGVIHRDIKPSQIMVGEFGEVQLMDWGIALREEEIRQVREQKKITQSTEGVPRRLIAGGQGGTAAFMSPEQTSETIENIGPWTDVYMLGGCLYFLLTGRTPHGSGDQNEAFEKAKLGLVEPPALKNPKREVPQELAEVAMNAMRARIEDRTQSAEEFVVQLQDYLSGVSNRRESVTLTGKVTELLHSNPQSYSDLDECHGMLDRAAMLWGENDRIPMLRDEVAMLYAQMALENDDLVLARLQSERMTHGDKRSELLIHVSKLEQEKINAAERLEKALNSAKDLIGFLIMDLHDGLRSIGRLDLLDKASRKILSHMEEFPEEKPTEETNRGRMRTLQRLASILVTQGQPASARSVLQQAIEISQQQVADKPSDYSWWGELAENFEAMASACYDQGDLDATIEWHQNALTIRIEIRDESPANPALDAAVAWSYHHLASAYWRRGNQSGARNAMLKATTIRRSLLEQFPDDSMRLRDIAWNHLNMGWISRATGDIKAAIREHETTLSIRRKLGEREPDSLNALGEVAWSLRSLGLLYEDAWSLDKGLDVLTEAKEISIRLAESDPANTRRRIELAFTHGALARMYQCREDWNRGEEQYCKGLGIQALLVTRDTSNARLHREYVYNLLGLSSLLFETGRIDEAILQAKKGLQISRSVLSRMDSENPSLKELEGRALMYLGLALLENGRKDEATANLTEAVGIFEPLLSDGEFPAVQEEPLALAHLALGQDEKAKPVVRRLKQKDWHGRIFLKMVSAAKL